MRKSQMNINFILQIQNSTVLFCSLSNPFDVKPVHMPDFASTTVFNEGKNFFPSYANRLELYLTYDGQN